MADPDRHPSGEELLRAEIARLKQREREHEAMIRELADAVAARDTFFGVVGHELRNPMGAIVVGITAVLRLARQAPHLPANLLKHLEIIERQSVRFTRRATTLLDVSRINRGQVRLDRDLVDASPLVLDVLEGLAADAERKKTEIVPSIEPGVTGWWDRVALDQIAFNLVSNAVKYGAGKPVEVSLGVDAERAVLTVADRGPGIPEADRRRIFEPFERAVSERHRGGFGLGLWIVRQLVVAMDGAIDVALREGGGSIFVVALPRAIQEAPR